MGWGWCVGLSCVRLPRAHVQGCEFLLASLLGLEGQLRALGTMAPCPRSDQGGIGGGESGHANLPNSTRGKKRRVGIGDFTLLSFLEFYN